MPLTPVSGRATIHISDFKMNAYCQFLGMTEHSCFLLQRGDLFFSVWAYAIMAALPLLVLFLITVNVLDVIVNGWGYPGDPGPWLGGRMLTCRDTLFPFFVIGWSWFVGCVALAAMPS
jgi:hypothetical protein